jgi:hypothetical protein
MRYRLAPFIAAAAVSTFMPEATSGQTPEAHEGVSFEEGDFTFHARELSRLDEGGVLMEDVRVSRKGADGVVHVEGVFLTDKSLLGFLSGACLRAPKSGEMIARGVRFRPDFDADVPGARNAEGLDIALATLDIELSGCGRSVSGALDDVEVSGVDGSLFSFDGADVKLDMAGSGRAETRLDFVNGRVTDAKGEYAGLSFSEAGVSLEGDREEVISVFSFMKDKDLESVLSLLAEMDASAGWYFRGLNIDTARFLPEEDRTRLGLDAVENVAGDAEMSLGAALGQVRMMTRFDLADLAVGDAFLRFSVPREKTSLPAAVTDRLPLPAPLLGVSLNRATLSYEDKGAGDVVEAATGRRPREIVEDVASERVESAAGRLPGGFAEGVKAAWNGVLSLLDGTASQAGLSPEAPVTLMDAGLSGISGSDALASRLGAYQKERVE